MPAKIRLHSLPLHQRNKCLLQEWFSHITDARPISCITVHADSMEVTHPSWPGGTGCRHRNRRHSWHHHSLTINITCLAGRYKEKIEFIRKRKGKHLKNVTVKWEEKKDFFSFGNLILTSWCVWCVLRRHRGPQKDWQQRGSMNDLTHWWWQPASKLSWPPNWTT